MKPITTFFLAASCAIACSASEPDRFGMDTGSPVSNTYKPPIAFTGTIQEVHVELK